MGIREKILVIEDEKNISRLMDLIEQIMDFNRFESDIMSLKLTQQDIISVCRNCMSYRSCMSCNLYNRCRSRLFCEDLLG